MAGLWEGFFDFDIVITVEEPEKNGMEAPIWGLAQFGEMSHPGS